MTLDEARAALEVAKLSLHTDATGAQVRNILDWAESVQDFLEAVEAAKVDEHIVTTIVERDCGTCEGQGHVPTELEPHQVWTTCPTCDGCGKVAAEPNVKPRCRQCNGSGRVSEEHQDFECSICNGSGFTS